MEDLRERTLKDLFSALDGITGPVLECKYYPCHFAGQDCSFCYCPFYPCLNYDMGGELKVTSDGSYVWSCMNCDLIHDREFSENVIFALSRYPRQRLVEEDWVFYSKILQELLYGEELAETLDSSYNLMRAILIDKHCEEFDNTEFLAVKVEEFKIVTVRKIRSIEEAENEIIIPIKERNKFYGFLNDSYVICERI
ncbi:Uncharacterized protein containing a Zn-finger-like domain [Archaeoglobus sulfaticallidus PM70-1]|uniref:Uncharacterized protein containing a Zn-finger-like domain n=1 Tax=Archaeoglobus sulfaticallidus PM70-1 TaxID=387631 RepID=N0BD70_9EURY|nr:cysteine-rich small domain-containing protein [Archaeoglobus sulfaticallidus]AGK60192.1 Uncharacterized protein containing a Zn-finger-like domain [Archaeoglobus sulfaticallidus PM70-1]